MGEHVVRASGEAEQKPPPWVGTRDGGVQISWSSVPVPSHPCGSWSQPRQQQLYHTGLCVLLLTALFPASLGSFSMASSFSAERGVKPNPYCQSRTLCLAC